MSDAKLIKGYGGSEGISSTGTAKSGAAFNEAAHGLRGIASILVFWAHLLGGTAEHIYMADPAYVELVQRPWHLGVWGVELFFVISGFVILPSVVRYAPGEFALRRFFRIYPLFFVFTLLFVILNAATNAYPHNNDPVSVISGFLFLNLFTQTEQLTPNAWSLTFEVMFYLLACGTYFAWKRLGNRLLAVVMLVLCFMFLIRWPIAAFFIFGVGIRILYDRGISISEKLARPLEIVAILACIVFASTNHFSYSQADMASGYLPWAIMVSTAFYFFLAVQPTSLTTMALKHRFWIYIGTVSYSLYLVHPYTYFALRGLFVETGLFTDNWLTSMALFFLITTPITMVATHYVHKWFEVQPYRRFFKQRIYRAPDSEKA